jgi:hypothetical protein
MRGYLYVLSNSSMPGLLKVGYTVRSIEERINELSSTGVPTRFDLEFFCEVDNAFLLEKEIHREIKKNHHGKEFFKCNIATVVRVVKLTLINNNYVIHSVGGKSSSTYLTNYELENIRKEQEIKEKQAQEIKRKEEEIRLAREAEKIEYNKKKDHFFRIALKSEEILSKYCPRDPVDKYAVLKESAWALGMLTGVGLLAIPFMDNETEWEKKIRYRVCEIWRKMTPADLINFRELHRTIKELKSCLLWDTVARDYRKDYDQSQRSCDPYLGLIKYETYKKDEETFGPSSLLQGIFKKMGLKDP